MPQIRCPNCGLTINLENRKDTDIDMITNAVKHDATTFTDLLRTTRLPRKTLSLRLKELCQNGTLAKMDGLYKLNGGSYSESRIGNPLTKFSSAVHDKRMRGFIMLGLLLVAFPTVSYVLASLVTPFVTPAGEQGPVILGTFSMALNVHDVSDLYAWQAVLAFSPDELAIESVVCDDSFESQYPFLPTPSSIREGITLIGGSLKGNVPGITIQGSGTLAVVEFGYYVNGYQLPQLVTGADDIETYTFATCILDSYKQEMPISDSTLTLDPILP